MQQFAWNGLYNADSHERRADPYGSRRISRGYPGESLICRASALYYAMPEAKRWYVNTCRIMRPGAKLDVRTYWNRILARTGTTLAKHRRSAWERRWRHHISVVQTLILLNFILERVKSVLVWHTRERRHFSVPLGFFLHFWHIIATRVASESKAILWRAPQIPRLKFALVFIA